MKYNTCPKCGTKVSADLAECPECGYVFAAEAPAEQAEFSHVFAANNSSAPAESPQGDHVFGTKKNRLPVIVGSALLIAAFAGGLAFNLRPTDAAPSPTPEAIETTAPTPIPTPTVEGIEIYAFGRELDADGFTAYVGDKGFTLSAYPVPSVTNPRIEWLSSDSFSLDVSDDTLTCVFTALKPSGKNELRVRCYGAEVIIPVYLWER